MKGWRCIYCFLKSLGAPSFSLMCRVDVNADLGRVPVSGPSVKIAESYPANALLLVFNDPERTVCSGCSPPGGNFVYAEGTGIGGYQPRWNRGIIHLGHKRKIIDGGIPKQMQTDLMNGKMLY